MINPTNFIYSVSAVRRMFNIPAGLRVRLVVWWRVAWVYIQGQRPRFISLKAFKQHFVDWRKSQANRLMVAQSSRNTYRVVNPVKSTAYTVTAEAEWVDCECEDFKNQILLLKQGCCKHCYAVLQQLGYSSLQAYLQF